MKRILSVVMAVVMLLMCAGLAGCQSDSTETGGDGTVIEEDGIRIEKGTADVGFTPKALGDVSARGWLLNQLKLQAENVTGDFEDLSADVAAEGPNKSAWLGGSGESWERGPYYVKGLVALAYALDDPELIEKSQKWIDWSLESQVESGCFGPHANNLDEFDWWAVMPMLFAIEEYYDATADTDPDERVIPFLEKYFAFQAKTLPKKPLVNWAVQRAGDNILAAYWLYEKNGDENLLELCKQLYKYSNWEGIYTRDAWTSAQHIVNVHQSLKLFPLMYQVTGDQEYLDIYYEGLKHLNGKHGRADGMSSGDEFSRGIDAAYGTETCAVAERMLSDEITLYITKDATIADNLELVAYNTWPSMLTPEITGQTYFALQNQVMVNKGNHNFTVDGGNNLMYGTPGGYPCCIHNMHHGWPLFVKSLWMDTSDGGVAVGAYGPSQTTLTVGQQVVTVTEDTDYPFKNTVTITLNMQEDATFPLYLRVPQWCDAPVLTVNGVQKNLPQVTGDYFKLETVWSDGAVIELSFPAEIKAEYYQNNSVAIRRGAVLYTLAIGEEWVPSQYNSAGWTLPEEYKTQQIRPLTDWNYALHNFDINNPAVSFTVEECENVPDDLIFNAESALIKLKANAVQVPQWIMNPTSKVAETVPISPVQSHDSAVTEVTLVPYAFARLRVTLLPWTGENQVIATADKTDEGLIFSKIIAPGEAAGWLYSETEYRLDMSYEATADATFTLFINGRAAGKITLPKSGTLLTDQLSLQPNYYNIVELRGDASAISGLTAKVVTEEETVKNRIVLPATAGLGGGSAMSYAGMITGLNSIGSSALWRNVQVPESGTYTLRMYYVDTSGSGSLTLFVDNQEVGKITYSQASGVFSPNIYGELTVQLTAGKHTVMVKHTANDRGNPVIDSLVFTLQ